MERLALVVPAALLVVGAIWLSRDANIPGTLAGVIGPFVPLALGLPGLWVIAAAVLDVPRLGRFVLWAGRHSLSVLVIQDVLRFTVGTLFAFQLHLGPYAWLMMPVYLGASVLLARAWDPFQRTVTDRCWPVRP